MGEDNCGGEVGWFLGCLFTDNAAILSVIVMDLNEVNLHIDLEERVQDVNILLRQIFVAERLDLLDSVIRPNNR